MNERPRPVPAEGGRLSLTPAPRFPGLIERRVVNVRTGEVYVLARADGVEGTAERLLEVTRACNEPGVYGWLFRERLQGEPYTPENAAKFFEWAREGWRNGAHFVFLLLSPKDEIAGAIDIKSADLENAEIGYWLSEAHGGVMTNAVVALAELAGKVGYERLHARVRPGNERSLSVLRRAGFAFTGEVREAEQVFWRFERDLRAR